MTNPFKFKQFTIKQEKSSMKVGTDGVLLGAWTNVQNATEILDIGGGTGLIALMIAQRSSGNITCVEIDIDSCNECSENVNSSPWENRIDVVNDSIQNFISTKKFDLIVSNPPFYSSFNEGMTKGRMTARQTKSLDYNTLINLSKGLLNSTGTLSIIVPFDQEEPILQYASDAGFFVNRIARVRGKVNGKIIRTLLELSGQSSSSITEEFAIEISRHNYTESFTNLVKDFYFHI